MPYPRISSLLLLLAAALCTTSVLGAGPCTTNVTAKAGDSCGTLADQYGIDIDQFKALNPDLVSCVLTAGNKYCVSDKAGGAPAPASPTATATATVAPPKSSSSSAAAPPPPKSSSTAAPPPPPKSSSSASAPPAAASTLVPSPDGSEGVCGGKYTCLGSVYGECCSANGFCGSTTEYCGDGCNPAFGTCGGGEPACEAAETETVTLLTVSTATVTAVKTAPAASARTVTVTVTGAARTVTAPARTVTAPARTVTVTAAAANAPSTAAPARPRPTIYGTNSRCQTYYQFKATDTCLRVVLRYGISLDTLYEWNPNLDCDDPESEAGYYICVDA
ncbi:hypothetical protein QBC33DRAFT_622452 [Phialemonium atrogriseum]|uniref:Chitin-binding type-1 domain-containing protein n=1 Tax=Phialemonium atrogriseum TaxID=1093897 RepID=A0AAJ0FJ34_9PEZI|nr:uncharacterized protein QBC33DRAFT_622452 [Phialemonium atrogriseum]KAK1763949.1 hypothetical protein QBC33DRAFT_622452 [Phialemonium atrogriseum]